VDRKFTRPLPAGFVTIHDWAGLTGRTWGTIHNHWKRRDGFPARAGYAPSPARNGGGLPEDVYELAVLEAWRVTQPALWGHDRGVRLILGRDPASLVTLAEFAEIAGLPAPDRGACPPPAAKGRWRLSDLVGWQNDQPPSAGPELAVTRLGADDLVSLDDFAQLVRRSPNTVKQFRLKDKEKFPGTVQRGRWRLADLAEWQNARPGRVLARKQEP
jgi:hypothetical protein